MDKNLLKTPLGNPLILPNAALAAAVAKERSLRAIASLAIDIVACQRDALIADMLSYLDTDNVCYRDDKNSLLYQQQEQKLALLLTWLEKALQCPINLTTGIMPIKQSEALHQAMRNILINYTGWELAVFATLAKPLASLLLAFAVMQKHLSAEEAFLLSQLEESYETRQWGIDEEKQIVIQNLRLEVLSAGEFLSLLS